MIPIGATGAGSLTAAAACTLSDAEIIATINEREQARSVKDFATSDLKREELRGAGVDVFDKDRCWKTNDGRQGRIGVSIEAHLSGGKEGMSEDEIDARLKEREQARAQKDWATADQIREELRARGIELYDQTSLWKASDGRVGMLPPQPGKQQQSAPNAEAAGAIAAAAAFSSMLTAAGGNPALAAAGLAANPAALTAALTSLTGAASSRDDVGGTLSQEAILALIEEREQARKSKNWVVADKIRDGMRARGVEIYDKTGQWRASDGREGAIMGAGRGGASAGMSQHSAVMVSMAARAPTAGDAGGFNGSGGGLSGGGGNGPVSEAEIVACLNQREVHRASKNWAQADVIRTSEIFC